MSYMDKNLVPGETLVYKTGCHWIVMLWPMLGSVVLGFFGFALFAGGWMATRKGASYQGAIVEGHRRSMQHVIPVLTQMARLA